MTKRQVLAATTLTALPMFVASTPATMTETDEAASHVTGVAPHRGGPNWSCAYGMEGEVAFGFALASALECSFFGPVGGVACGVTSAF